jgi:hypothetical protein
MRAHTITTKASTIVSGGILTLGLAVVLLAATASTASAERALSTWNCPPPPTPPTTPTTIAEIQGCLGHGGLGRPFDFGDRQRGTTSPAQGFALGVFENDSFNPRISVSGDYAQTNNCPPTLSVTAPLPLIQGCLITVTFTPTGTGPKEGTLSTGPGGPKARLIGNGVTHPTPWPGLHLSGDKTQKAARPDRICDRDACDVLVEVSCGDEECTARATGKLTKVKEDKLTPDGGPPYGLIAPGETMTLGPELTKPSQRREVREALAEGKNVQAKITVRAKDTSGKVTTAKRTIKLVE